MKQYYYAIGSEQKGPFTIEELAIEKISKETLVWFDGQEDWKPAGELEELKGILKVVPPPLKSVVVPPVAAPQAEGKNSKKRYVKIAAVSGIVLVLITVSILLGVAWYEQSFREDLAEKMRQYETELPAPMAEEPKPLTEAELKAQLHEKECQQPKAYLEGKMGYKVIYKNLLSMKVTGLKLNGSLANEASMATFKDVKIKVKLLSNTGTSLFQKTFVVYDFIPAKSGLQFSHEIEITNQTYQDMADFEWSIVGASCVR